MRELTRALAVIIPQRVLHRTVFFSWFGPTADDVDD
jgi:hypothetical protein